MLSEHPDLLSIFEFFNGIEQSRRFLPGAVSGEDFAALIAAEQPFVTAVVRRGYDVPEIVYPFGEGRYRRDEPLPWILVSMLPRISSDPDGLFDALMAYARKLPRQPLIAHYRSLFAWLAECTGRSLWLERSGSSIEYLDALIDAFPEARFLHLHRDGREVALSMRNHHAYRLPISILYGAPVASGKSLADLGPIDIDAAPTQDDPITQILASRPPPVYFGRYWKDQILRGHRATSRLGADRHLEVRFEDLVAEPQATLETIAAFFALPERGDWRGRAAALVRGVPRSRFGALPADEAEALAAACHEGQVLVGREA